MNQDYQARSQSEDCAPRLARTLSFGGSLRAGFALAMLVAGCRASPQGHASPTTFVASTTRQTPTIAREGEACSLEDARACTPTLDEPCIVCKFPASGHPKNAANDCYEAPSLCHPWALVCRAGSFVKDRACAHRCEVRESGLTCE
jgi:hypothetical protein